MQSLALPSLLFMAIILPTFVVVQAEKDMELYCAACHMLVDEMFWELKNHDPKKKLEVGSFRMDAHGKTHTKKVEFLTSESYLTELFETVCNEAEKYIQNTQPDGSRIFKRMQSRDGTPLGLNNITYNPDAVKALRGYCDATVEEFEDTLLDLFQSKHPDLKNHFCIKITGYCKKEAPHPYAAVEAKKKRDAEEEKKREERRKRKKEKKAKKAAEEKKAREEAKKAKKEAEKAKKAESHEEL